jgi:thioredoxin 1
MAAAFSSSAGTAGTTYPSLMLQKRFHHQFQVINTNNGRRSHGRPRSSSSSSALGMVATKSGGRAILSELQFQIEVLHSQEQLNEQQLQLQLELQQDEQLKAVAPSNDEQAILCTDSNDSNSSNNNSSNNNSNNNQSKTQTFQPRQMPTLVFFTAPWCGPCRLSNPVVKEIIKQFVPKIDVVEVCTDDLPDIAEQASVTSIPTIQIYHQGDLLDTIVGCVAKNVLGNAVNKVLEGLGIEGTALKHHDD